MTDYEFVERLKAWAEPKGLTIHSMSGTQREPENIVSVFDESRSLVSKTSSDSCNMAAFYVINTLGRLGIDVP